MTDKKVLTIDIETGLGPNGFKPDLSIILCLCYKWNYEDKVHALSILDNKDLAKLKIQDWDKIILTKFAEVIKDADLIVGHYSSVFDIPYITGRLLIHNMKPYLPVTHFDTCMKARGLANFSSNRLGNLSKVIKLRHQKLDKQWPLWWIEMPRDPYKYMPLMIKYCKGDILPAEELYKRLNPFVYTVPTRKRLPVEDEGFCPKCGDISRNKHGYSFVQPKKYIRYQCHGCGSWYRSKEPVK